MNQMFRDLGEAYAALPPDVRDNLARAAEVLRPPPRWTCDDDCGRIHSTYESALRHAEKRGSMPVPVRS